MTDRLYLVDSSDPTQWDETVRQPAERVTEAFLSGGTCPHPNDLSEKANAVLTERHGAAEKRAAEEIVNKKCDICGVRATTDAAWEKHIKNRRHKRRVKAAANWEKWQAYKKRLEEENEAKVGEVRE
jgi:tRNA dimethylallyltransferase